MTEVNPEKRVQLAHGGGGSMQNELVHFITDRIPVKRTPEGIGVDALDDGALIPLSAAATELVVTADGHTIDPLFFPGGDLGKLAATGTINDLIMMGAKPIAITSIITIEEGTPFTTLGKVIDSFNRETAACNVAIVAGDTKVMPKGTLKEIIMGTTGIGIRVTPHRILDSNCQPGAKILLTGGVGQHGAALMARREGIALETTLESDVASLLPLQQVLGDHAGIFAMKDPTRGGLASALNEWAEKSKVSIWIDEEKIPLKREVRAVADILGLDPLEITNEGKAILCVAADKADAVLQRIRSTEIGKDAQIIGDVQADRPGRVFMRTAIGGTRIIEMPQGEPIPRVC